MCFCTTLFRGRLNSAFWQRLLECIEVKLVVFSRNKGSVDYKEIGISWLVVLF